MIVLLCLVASLAPSVGSALAEEASWPQFRGVLGDGVARGGPRLAPWDSEGPREVWRVAVGEGFASVSAVGSRVFTLFADDESEFVGAFDADTGRELWRRRLGDRFEEQYGDGPRSTPAVDGARVYAVGSHGRLTALAVEDGGTEWSLDLRERFGGKVPLYGHVPSPLLEGDAVILEVGGGEGEAIAAVDCASGEVRWTAHSDKMGYSSPIVLEAAGERSLVFATPTRILGLSLTGETLWQYEMTGTSGLEFPISSPVAVPPDRVYVAHRGDGGSLLMRIDPTGGYATEEVWASRLMVNHWSSSVHLDGTLYGFHNATLKAVSAATGEVAWAKRGLGKGSLIAAGGRLLVLSDRGELLLVDATPAGYRELGRMPVLTRGKSWTAPAVVGSRVYLRNHLEMVALDLPIEGGEE